MRRWSFLFPALLAVFALAQDPPQHFDGNTWWHYVSVLADDNMEGRETGSPGLTRAEEYVIGELKKAGLQPAGSRGFYQDIKFVSRQIDENNSSLALVRGGNAQTLTLGDDAFFSTRVDLAPRVEAPLVFAGYGLRIPENNYDDLAGLDLKGKVAVIFSAAPADIPGPLASHAQSASERWKAFREAGAVGLISIPNPAAMDIPWSRMSLNRAHPSMVLAGAEFDETPGAKLAVTFNPTRAQSLFEGSGHTFDELVALVRERKPLPRFPLAVAIRATAKVDQKQIQSSNIVARLEGGDPKLKDEFVVMTAHIDHLGIGEPINGDRIYNGAMDNGSGSAALLDIAQSLAKSRNELKRSVLFVWVTGEEKGLLGSRYFAAKPTVARQQIVADINMDMFLPIIPLKVLTVYGLAESDLGDWVRQAAATQNVPLQADPEPQRNAFIRSDQYSFIKQGIPSVAMGVGFTEETRQIHKDWLTNRYHAPSDDLQQPVDKQSAAKYEEIVRELAVRTAAAPSRPQWKQDSFFRRYAAPTGGQ